MTLSGALSEDERRARLRLARTSRIGPVTFAELLRRYGSAEAAVEALPALSRRSGRALDPASLSDISAELERGEALGARLLVLGDETWPARLAALDPPPPVLWVMGDAALLTREPIAIVGARTASVGGQRIARGLATRLGEAGHVIVSGLALGIDGAAHTGALASGTVAVLGGGIDDIYPSAHEALYGEIARRGAIVSESPPGTRAQAKDFPRRNRIISGLCLGVIVVEAEMRSGSLITARLAAEQGREVFSVPGSPLDPRARGTNDLIRQGAHLCEEPDDVLRVLNGLRTLYEPPRPDWSGEPAAQNEIAEDEIDESLIARIDALLSPVPTPRDELARALHVDVALISAALLELTIAGRAALLPGGLVCRA